MNDHQLKVNVSRHWFRLFVLVYLIHTIPLLSGEKTKIVANRMFDSRPAFNLSHLTEQEIIKQDVIFKQPPSMGKAFLYSFLLPGAGELYAGSKKMAAIFAGTEILLWTTFFSFRAYGSCKEDDYINYAIAHAGIDPSGKDHQYFIDIEHFDDIRAYNEAKLRQRNVDALYSENDEYNWKWDSKSSRLKYEEIRVASDKAFSRSIMVIGAIVANHIISGIDAIRVAKKREKDFDKQVKIGFVPRLEGGIEIALFKMF